LTQREEHLLKSKRQMDKWQALHGSMRLLVCRTASSLWSNSGLNSPRQMMGVPAVALHMIDFDGFKQVNDNYGHPAGDALLRAVAERLARVLRAGDIAVRLGGDEFAIIQKGIAVVDEANLLGRRIVRQLAEPFAIGNLNVRIGASIGIAHAPADTTDIDQLINYADSALYTAKRTGRGNVSMWRSLISAAASRAA
jgi:diguanylate cyclase (GGDEF)-like protein